MNKQLTQEQNFDEVEFISGYVMQLIKLTEQNIQLAKQERGNMLRKYNKKMFLDYASAFDYSEDIKDGCIPYKSDEELKKDMKDNWKLKDFHSMYGFTHYDWESGYQVKYKKNK